MVGSPFWCQNYTVGRFPSPSVPRTSASSWPGRLRPAPPQLGGSSHRFGFIRGDYGLRCLPLSVTTRTQRPVVVYRSIHQLSKLSRRSRYGPARSNTNQELGQVDPLGVEPRSEIAIKLGRSLPSHTAMRREIYTKIEKIVENA